MRTRAHLRRSTPPTRWIPLLAAVVMLTGWTLVGCSAPDTYEPSVPTADFRPKLLIVVDDNGIRTEPGERDDPAVSVDPAKVPAGTVTRVENRSSGDHRLQGNTGAVFDTAVMKPGDTTIVVLDHVKPDDLDVVITDRQPDGQVADGSLTVTVTARRS
jgi:hypothetical protein